MSLRYEYPKTLGLPEMFEWWCKEKIRKKRYMRLVNQKSNSAPTQLIAKNSDELDWLRKHVLVLAEKIEKLEIEDKGNRHFTARTREIYEKKRELFEANQRIDHLQQVDSATVRVIMTEKKFRQVIEEFNIRLRDRIIENGEIVNMKNNMGFVYVQRIDRFKAGPTSKSASMPNWGESYKYRDELIAKGITPKSKENPDGKNWIVYYDDDYYLRVAWAKNKGACRVKNHPYYKFVPNNSIGGTKRQLIDSNRKDPLLYKIYNDHRIYYPRLNPNYQKK